MYFIDEKILKKQIPVTIIDIKELSQDLIKTLDKYIISICEGKSDNELKIVKLTLLQFFENKSDKIKIGAIAEFFIHLYIHEIGYKQECLFRNLEENSIKKGFDGFYSTIEGYTWIMESKAGMVDDTSKITHSSKVLLAMNDLIDKVSGQNKGQSNNLPNNPWNNAYNHASNVDVDTDEKIRKYLKNLSNEFVQGQFHSIEEFNVMPCGTIFLTGIWNQYNHDSIMSDLESIIDKLKGKNIHIICVTQLSKEIFLKYLKL